MKTRFGPFTLDSDTRQLLRGDTEMHLSRKAFDLLSTLLAQQTESHGERRASRRALARQPCGRGRSQRPHRRLRARWVTMRNGRSSSEPCMGWDTRSVARRPDAGETGPGSGTTTPCWLVWGDRRSGSPRGERDWPRPAMQHLAGCAARVAPAREHRDQSRARYGVPERPGQHERDVSRTLPSQSAHGVERWGDIKIGTVALKFRRWFAERAPETRRIRRTAKGRTGPGKTLQRAQTGAQRIPSEVRNSAHANLNVATDCGPLAHVRPSFDVQDCTGRVQDPSAAPERGSRGRLPGRPAQSTIVSPRWSRRHVPRYCAVPH